MAKDIQSYFDKHYKELTEFLAEQFEKVAKKDDVDKQFDAIDKRFEEVDKRFEAMEKRFQEQDIKLDFIQFEVANIRKELTALAKRTKEDDNAFTKELFKLRIRIDSLEKQVKKLKAKQPT